MTAGSRTVPMGADEKPAGMPFRRGLRRRHVLMLALAVEVLVLGFRGAEGYQPPGIAVEQTLAKGHVIT